MIRLNLFQKPEKETKWTIEIDSIRLFLWPVVFLYYLGQALEEFRWRIWMAMWVTANWTLGQKGHNELACVVLKKQWAKARLRIWRSLK